jgi:hypothetical protein
MLLVGQLTRKLYNDSSSAQDAAGLIEALCFCPSAPNELVASLLEEGFFAPAELKLKLPVVRQQPARRNGATEPELVLLDSTEAYFPQEGLDAFLSLPLVSSHLVLRAPLFFKV